MDYKKAPVSRGG